MSALIDLRDDRSERVRYDDGVYPIYIRRGILSLYPDYAAPIHWHDDIELIAVLDGEMDYNVNGTIVTLCKGEGIFVNSRQLHFGFSEPKTECAFICILLHPLLLCSTPGYERDFVLPVIHSDTPYIFLDPGNGWQRAILREIHKIDRCKGQKTTPLKVQSAFSEIWSLLYEHIPSEGHTTCAKSTDLTAVRNMVGFIQKNYSQKISLQDIALSGAVGISKCCMLFARFFDLTPNTYLNHYRLGKGLELLRQSDRTVTDIALSVGFGSASYFTETFRKFYGTSPTEYRKQNCAQTDVTVNLK